jgi:hypothetical protein
VNVLLEWADALDAAAELPDGPLTERCQQADAALRALSVVELRAALAGPDGQAVVERGLAALERLGEHLRSARKQEGYRRDLRARWGGDGEAMSAGRLMSRRA